MPPCGYKQWEHSKGHIQNEILGHFDQGWKYHICKRNTWGRETEVICRCLHFLEATIWSAWTSVIQICSVVRTINLLYRSTGIWFHCILSLHAARTMHRLGERGGFSPHPFYLISCEPSHDAYRAAAAAVMHPTTAQRSQPTALTFPASMQRTGWAPSGCPDILQLAQSSLLLTLWFFPTNNLQPLFKNSSSKAFPRQTKLCPTQKHLLCWVPHGVEDQA